MTFERTFDLEMARRIMTHPRIWSSISDDGSPSPDQFQPPDHPSIWYVAVKEDERTTGVLMFVPQTSACFEIHTCLLPSGRGPRAKRAAPEMVAWMFHNSPARRIVTTVPAFNPLALRLALAAGMTQYGINPQSYPKNGRLWDQALLGISKENACLQQ